MADSPAERIMASESAWDRAFGSNPPLAVTESARPLEAAQRALWMGDYRRSRRLCILAERAGGPVERVVALYRRMGLNEDAVACLSRAIRKEPGSALRRLARAALHEEQGRYREALAGYEAAAKLDPWSMRAKVFGAARLRLWAGEERKAASAIRSLLKAAPEFPGAMRIGGALLVSEGRFEKASLLLSHAVRLSPSDGEAFLWRAEALLRLGRLREAGRDADQALRTGGNPLLTGVLQALIRLARGEAPGDRELNFIRSLLPPGAKVRTRGLSTRFGGWERRISPLPPRDPRGWLEEILQAFPGNRSSTLAVANGRGLKPCPAIHPRQPMADLQMSLAHRAPAEVLADFGRRAKAARGLERSRWLVHRGEVCLWLGRYRQALRDISAGLAFPPQDSRWSRVGAAGARMFLGDLKGALRAVLAAAEAGAPAEVLRPWRGELCRRLGRLDEALDDFEQATRMARFVPSSWVNLGLTYKALGREGKRKEVVEILRERCPYFMSAAISLDAALNMMRGNRSNRLFTYYEGKAGPRIITVEAPREGRP